MIAKFIDQAKRSTRLRRLLTKEALLAARMSRRLAVYVIPIEIGPVETISLITAFFDDEDEPLVLRTPLFANEPHTHSLLTFLTSSGGCVHFFDYHSREMLAYRCRISVPASTRARLEMATFADWSQGMWREIDDQAQEWFSVRTGDAQASGTE